ncbi:MAG: SgcJ/EcaC family oxidoreductase [Alphaproteobacteria bacterium]|nr:SgcJ/EcaC family oxidoreductase [Alphaproteobacteria bacterium]MBV9859905.1 SgcJ/EcaC family oxidoreductase [Alphaproteobacteria bacterium]
MLRSTLLALCLAVFSALAQAQSKADIDKLNEAWAAAFNKGDAAAVAGMYADDAVLLPPGSEMIAGRAAIEAFWRDAGKQIGDIKLTAVDVMPLGDGVGREIGTFTAMSKENPAQSQPIVGKYVVIWQRAGSDWKLATDIFNTND